MPFQRLLCLLLATFALGSLPAQTISIAPERASGLFQAGETIRWQIAVTEAAKLSDLKFSLKSGGLTAIASGALSLTNGQATVQTTAGQPGWLLLEVSGTKADATTLQAHGGALVEPEKITPGAESPADFDSFWEGQLAALAAVPINPVVTPGSSDRAGVDYATVMLDGIGGTHVQGQIAKPATGTKFPALLIVQWAGVYGLQKSWATWRAAQGWLVLNTQAHDIAPLGDDAYYTGLANGSLKDYPRIGNEDRETSYFLRMYLACHRAAEYLATRPDWDGRTLVVTGASQGGLQALVTAALHPKITAVVADVPAGSDQAGLDAGRVPGWPMWAWQAWDRDLAKVKQTSRYFDVTNFAPRVTCPVLMGVGLIDTVVPPPGVYATYNLLPGARQIVPMPLADHSNGHTAYNTAQDAWLADARTARLPRIDTPPQPVSTRAGGAAVLSVAASNGQVLGYQWLKNGSPIPGATADRLAFASVAARDTADYRVVVTSPGGSVTSDPVRLSVAATPRYTWNNVVIRGGGFVSGLLFHPTRRHLLYARTDVGGAYRWEQDTGTWTPLNDALGMDDSQLTGVLSFAVDPTDDRRLYLACGQYLPSWARTAAILRSSDRGATWARTELPIKLGGNADGRAAGERLQVDPNKPSTLLLGTNQNGLWKSTDSGATWARLATFTPSGVTFVLFDARSGGAGAETPTLYAGVDSLSASLYRSTDGGATWAPVAGAPTGLIPNHADFDSAGMLYLSYANHLGPNGMTTGAIWKFNPGSGAWTNISPRTPTASDTFGWGAISVGKTGPGILVATTNDRWAGGDEVWRSTDGGATWTNLNPIDSYDAGATAWAFFHGTASTYRPHWLADVDIDPFDENRVLFVTGGGIWGTDTAFGGAPVWTFRNDGLEETVPLEVASPPRGPLLLSALGDIGGFRHESLDASPPEENFYNPVNSTNVGLDFAEAAPDHVVRTNYATTRGSYSTDGGATWTNFATCPATATAANGGPGKIAIAADASRLVWYPDNSAPYCSADRGATWTPCTGAPTGSFHPVADRANAAKFYLYDSNAGRVHVSIDGGRTFASAASVPAYGAPMRAVPGAEGHLWLPAWSAGLRRSTDSGASFSPVTSVQEAYRIGFGKAAPGRDHPAVYLWGKVNGTVGFFRSDDTGATWTRLNDDQHQYGWINAITGDPRVYGRVYLATGGRGIVYGELEGSGPEIATAPASRTLPEGDPLNLSVAPQEVSDTLTYRWLHNGIAVPGATAAALVKTAAESADAGLYVAQLGAHAATTLSEPAVVGVIPTGRTAGAVTTRDEWQNIRHPNGNVYDQFLLTGAAGTITADTGQIARLSFLDEEDSIVQVEMSGPGAITVVLARPAGPVAPALYNQTGIAYMRGAPTVVLAGATADTYVSIFSVGRVTNPGVTRADVTYNGWANVRSLGILSTTGSLGGLFLGNVLFVAEAGPVGLFAPNVRSVGTVNLHEIMAWEAGRPGLAFEPAAQVAVRITGGSLLQLNGLPVRVRGLASVRMAAGQGSSGEPAPAQTALGELVEDGNDVTSVLVTGP